MDQQAYLDLLDLHLRDGATGPADFFSGLRSVYGLDHILYVADQATGPVFHTLPKEIATLLRKALHVNLPAVLEKLQEVDRPTDLSDLTARIPECGVVLHLARLHNLPEHGAFCPLRKADGCKAFLFYLKDLPEAEWLQYRDRFNPQIHMLAQIYQTFRNGRPRSALVDAPVLTPREYETLAWVSAGKSYWEISVIMQISERTVRHFMGNVRAKLDAVSNTQAVAAAIRRGILPNRSR